MNYTPKYTYNSLEYMWTEGYVSFIRSHMCKHGNWDGITGNPTVTIEVIENNPDLPWCHDGLSYNPSISLDFIKNNPHYSWNWDNVSINESITWDEIKENSHFSWDWYGIARRMSWDIIKENLIL